ncbi:PIN domain-containing protein [Streptomyces halstedii]|uniref:PIN domain-containing protein n=1 Tax=Streptomyces halstedii TaxID=1944 RepID=UPI003806C0B2
MSESAPSARRTMYPRGSLRCALLDTSVLTTDIIAATRRPALSSFVAGARAGTVRHLIPVHVWEEVPRVLTDRHREGGRFDLERALKLWQVRYAPLLYVVDTTGLPMTRQAEALAARDVSDVPMLLLAGVIAPVVLIGTDKDLVASGLADSEWRELRSALGDVGVTEGRMIDLELQAGAVLNLTSNAFGSAFRKAFTPKGPKQIAVTVAVSATVAGGLYLWGRKRPLRPTLPSKRKPVLPTLVAYASKRMTAHETRHARGEDRWRQAELGTPGDTLLHQVARTVVGSREPLTRTAIVERLGEAVPGAGHTGRMTAVLDVLTTHPMFVDVKGRGRWQVGRLGS